MKSYKSDRKNNKKAIRKIQKLIDSSKLNPFILFHYTALKESELESNRESMVSLIKYNNKVISQLKEEIKDKNICEVHKEIVKKYIDELEYSNGTSKEVIRIINLKKREFYHKKLQKNYNKFFKKNTKLSATI
ncbi:MAG: hypothetical protein IJI22_05785 [Bacilli bacterium]|nr:hypothetical protein [Bacilli bacterium]